jgi:hypothetical protein
LGGRLHTGWTILWKLLPINGKSSFETALQHDATTPENVQKTLP